MLDSKTHKLRYCLHSRGIVLFKRRSYSNPAQLAICYLPAPAVPALPPKMFSFQGFDPALSSIMHMPSFLQILSFLLLAILTLSYLKFSKTPRPYDQFPRVSRPLLPWPRGKSTVDSLQEGYSTVPLFISSFQRVLLMVP